VNPSLALSFFACAACGGNPESSLTKGVIAGVLFLLAVITCVLGGIAWTAFSWSRRAKKIEPSFKPL